MSFLRTLVAAAVFTVASAYASASQMVTVQVNGLVCDFCARSLEATFGKRPEVASIKVDLDTKLISIAMNEGQDIDDTTIRETVIDAGFEVVAIERAAAP